MSKKLKSKTFNCRYRHQKNTNKRGKIKHSGRNKIIGGEGVTLNIPPIIRMNNGGSDSQASMNDIYKTADAQQRIVKALTGGSGTPETYTVPTFANSGDPHSTIPNSNSVTRALVGALVESQVQSEYDKNAFIKQSGGIRKHKSKNRKRTSRIYKYKNRKHKSRKSYNKNK